MKILSTKLKKALVICAVMMFGFQSLSQGFGDWNFGFQFPNGFGEKRVVNYETYRVRAGDTFWDISEHYRNLDDRNLYIFEYQDELRELNPFLKDRHNQLQPNDIITVRYYTVSVPNEVRNDKKL